jgi:hypothetical protein
MNAGALIFIVLAVMAAGFAIFVFSPLGKKTLFEPEDEE